ncbi:unnamed protein product [Hymenolepis diminuta]|uniref:Uncharacterized protein n=1 Tax=Hymenolepis diminuta TaxID=6216 RepID=A0A564YL29_HYMDI|nr:unnamed protein product [Hymenolepis diminuta]
MADAIITNEIDRHAVTVSIKAKHRNLEIARFLQVVRSVVWKVRKELLNENNGDAMVTTRKRKEHCERSADSFRISEFVRREQKMT